MNYIIQGGIGMYKIAICDDCREALREIEKLLRRYIEKNKIRAVVEAYQSQMQLLTKVGGIMI